MKTAYQVLWAPKHINARMLGDFYEPDEVVWRREVFDTLPMARRIARNRKKADFYGQVSIIPVAWDPGWREWEPIEGAEVENL